MTLRSYAVVCACALYAGCGLVGCRAPDREPAAPQPAEVRLDTVRVDAPGFLYGRVVTRAGQSYTGRLRWGGDEEAFWSDTFNGAKSENRWAEHAPLPERRPLLFGIEMPGSERLDTRRPFMARFGDIARIESVGEGMRELVEEGARYDPVVRVTLKSGTAFDLDRLEASDFDDGVRVWDHEQGVVDLGPRQIHSISLLPTEPIAAAPARLYGTVDTERGPFSGFIQWDREQSVSTDLLVGRSVEGEAMQIPFGTIRQLARHPDGLLRVEQHEGTVLLLGGSRDAPPGARGVYVDDPRYGRVLVPWSAFQQAVFTDAGSGPGYADFPPGRPLSGRVVLRSGETVEGRLVFDLDESETTETLDAPAAGIDYTIPFGHVASIRLPTRGEAPAAVQLQSGETLTLERAGDLGAQNGGMLVFTDGRDTPVYVPWPDVERVDFQNRD